MFYFFGFFYAYYISNENIGKIICGVICFIVIIKGIKYIDNLNVFAFKTKTI